MAAKKSQPGSAQEMFLKELSAFEQRLGAKIGGVEQRLDARIGELDRKIDGVEQRLDGKIVGLDKKIDGVEQRLDARIGGLDARIGGLDARISGLDKKIGEVDKKIDGTEQRLNKRIDGVGVDVVGVKLVLDARMYALEQRLASNIDSAVESMKEFTNSRFSQVIVRMDAGFVQVDTRFDDAEKSLKTKVEGLVEMIERRAGESASHDRRITALESRA